MRPAGANEAVRTLVDGGAPRMAVIALNDAIADGRDVSWIWDVDFEPLLDGLDARFDNLTLLEVLFGVVERFENHALDLFVG